MRFTTVDALRGFAAMSVLLYHATDAGHISQFLGVLPGFVEPTLRLGYLGVAVFFVLSGYVIAHSLSEYAIGANNYWRFVVRRSLRLDLPYWAAIFITIGFQVLAARIMADHRPLEYSAPQILAHMVYLQDILGYPPISDVFWTLCYEIQFYLFYAFLIFATGYDPRSKLRKPAVAIVLASFAVIGLLWPLGLGSAPRTGLFPNLWYAFVLGAGCYWAWKDRYALVPFVVYAGIVLVAGLVRNDPYAITCALTSFFLLICSLSDWIYSSLSWRPLQLLGLISYSLYLTHNPVTGAAFRVASKLTERTPLMEALWLCGAICACLVFASGLWWLVERPSLKWSRMLKLKRDAGERPDRARSNLSESVR